MVRENLGSNFPLISLTNLLLPLGTKQPREAEHEFMSQLGMRVRESTSGGHTSALRTRKGVRDPIVLAEAHGPPTQPKGRVRILEGRGDRLMGD